MRWRPATFQNPTDFSANNIRKIPFIGEFGAMGWEVIDTAFVDKTGLGLPSEPALTIEQFIAWGRAVIEKHPGVGFGAHDEGQFQIYVSAYVLL